MRRCTRCVMPDTRPGSIFDEEGVCQACRNYDARQQTDWAARHRELEDLCDAHRREQGYDVLLPVSGGKDSHVLVGKMLDLGMHPLLCTVTDPFTHTKAGMHNLKNIQGMCDHMSFTLREDLHRQIMRRDFEAELHPLKCVELLIYLVPVMMANRLRIDLLFFGENSAYLYGTSPEDVADMEPLISGMWEEFGANYPDLTGGFRAPDFTSLQARYMSYYLPWDDEDNAARAETMGWWDLTVADDWDRAGWIEPRTQIDSVAYIVHIGLKYPKFGFQRTADMASRWVRKGNLTRDAAMELLELHEAQLDRRAVADFCKFCGYTREEFRNIINQHPLTKYRVAIPSKKWEGE